jgi:hypothetical protein
VIAKESLQLLGQLRILRNHLLPVRLLTRFDGRQIPRQ